MKLTHDGQRRPGGRLRELGRLVAITAIYLRPGMPIQHVPPITGRRPDLSRIPTRGGDTE